MLLYKQQNISATTEHDSSTISLNGTGGAVLHLTPWVELVVTLATEMP